MQSRAIYILWVLTSQENIVAPPNKNTNCSCEEEYCHQLSVLCSCVGCLLLVIGATNFWKQSVNAGHNAGLWWPLRLSLCWIPSLHFFTIIFSCQHQSHALHWHSSSHAFYFKKTVAEIGIEAWPPTKKSMSGGGLVVFHKGPQIVEIKNELQTRAEDRQWH